MRQDTGTDESLQARTLAVRLLERVLRGELPLDHALAHRRASPLLSELIHGVCRHYYSLKAHTQRRLNRPLRRKDADIECLLLIGALQLLHLRVPAHAAVHTSVEVARRLGKPWAAKLINAVLRAVTNTPQPARGPEARFDHPAWLIAEMREQYPSMWRDLLAVNLSRAPMSLRVNTRRGTVDACRASLRADGQNAMPGAVPGSLVLERPTASNRLQALRKGLASVQDEGAQLAALLLAPQPGMRILDACAAPGNKGTHILELAPDISPTRAGVSLTCIDPSARRLERLHSQCVRLALPAPRVFNTRLEALSWWDGRPFDAVLLDVPCSGTGTLRRHPDIKILASRCALERHQEQQSRLLRAAWRTLAPGGRLLYSTCSMLRQENDDSLRALARRSDALARPLPLIKTLALEHQDTAFGVQLLPRRGGPDAMFYALFEKAA